MLSLVMDSCATATPEPTQAPTEVPIESTAVPEPTGAPEPKPMDIVDTAVANGHFSALVVASQVPDVDT